MNLDMNLQKCMHWRDVESKKVEWEGIASLKNISYQGAYFEYAGAHTLRKNDVIYLEMTVSVPVVSPKVKDSIPLRGFGTVVRVKKESGTDGLGVGIRFIHPISSKLSQ